MSEPILLPRTGPHVSIWGSGHSCDYGGKPHDGPCVCECGLTNEAAPDATGD
jgi:hypothetical protein